MKEWVVDMLGPGGQRIDTAVLAEGVPDEIMSGKKMNTIVPQRLEWIISRIVHDIPYWRPFQVRNVATGEIIPGDVFGL
ncbi:MAG: hypothetical protein MN733_08920 [Nitrososphaera sp.]|nr:hypothetical protein [Nitrososphaera sp.]